MKFRAKVELGGKTATGIEVPAAVGRFMLPVSAEVREAAGVAAGDQVDVDVELDTAPRELTVPADFARALTRDAPARPFFEGLSFSNKQRMVI